MYDQESFEFLNTVQTLNGVQDIKNMAKEIKEEFSQVTQISRVFLRDQQNPLEAWNDKKFQSNLAFTKDSFIVVLDIFKHKLLKPSTPSVPSISQLLKLTLFLQYLRSISYYR